MPSKPSQGKVSEASLVHLQQKRGGKKAWKTVCGPCYISWHFRHIPRNFRRNNSTEETGHL